MEIPRIFKTHQYSVDGKDKHGKPLKIRVALQIRDREITEWEAKRLRQALREAQDQGSIENMKLCLEQGADPNTRDKNGNTMLINAIRLGNMLMINLLLENGAGLEHNGAFSKTPIMVAAECHNPKICEMLLERGARIDALDGEGQTALIHSMQSGSMNKNDWIITIFVLLSYGADPFYNDGGRKTSAYGMTEYLSRHEARCMFSLIPLFSSSKNSNIFFRELRECFFG
jgi:ankyrin repeat protein